jgi:hypothetical protein
MSDFIEVARMIATWSVKGMGAVHALRPRREIRPGLLPRRAISHRKDEEPLARQRQPFAA